MNRFVGDELCLDDAIQAPQPLVEAVGSRGSSRSVYPDPDVLHVGFGGAGQNGEQERGRDR